MRMAVPFRRVSPRRAGERGFVLLFVFALAAGAAIMLYLEAPRIAFQHQRNKEAMLVDRGEQYKRALELYVRKYNKFPQNLDELEKPDNVRLLRRRYKDPMTGKDEWRLIHIDNAGQYVDSLVHKREEEQKKERHLLEADVQGIGASAVSASDEQGGPSPFLQRTASDRLMPGQGGAAGAAPAAPGAGLGMEESSSRSGPAPPPGQDMGMMPGDPPEPQGAGAPSPFAAGGMLRPGGQQAGMPAGQGQQGPGQVGQMPQQGQQAAPSGGGFGFGGGGFGMGSGSGAAQAGSPPPSPFLPPQQGGTPNPQMPQQARPGMTVPGVGQQTPNPSGAPAPTGNEALRMIQNQLTRPTPQTSAQGGGFGAGSGQNRQQGQQQGQLAGGLAGVASTLNLEGIRVYNERTNYREWEFLADLQKIRGGGNAQGGQGAPGGQGGRPGGPGQGQGQGQGGQQMGPGGARTGGGNNWYIPAPGQGQGQGQGRPPGGGGGGFGFGGGTGAPPRK